MTGCVYPSKFAIDTNLYNPHTLQMTHEEVVYILQNLLLILTYTTPCTALVTVSALCISFKICY